MGQDMTGGTSQPAGGSAPSGGSGASPASYTPGQPLPQNYDFGFGQSPTSINPGEKVPWVQENVNLPAPNPAAGQDVRNAFMPAVFSAPYYNAAATAGNLGTMQTAGVAPAAAQFMQSQFDPNLNQMEQSFMQAGLSNASRALEQGMLRQEAQFEETPFHSGLARAQGDVMSQVADSLIGQGAQLGLQRQQMANQTAQFPFTYGLQAAQVGPNMSERYFNLLNTAFQQPLQLPQATYSQVPVPSPVVNTGGGGGGLK